MTDEDDFDEQFEEELDKILDEEDESEGGDQDEQESSGTGILGKISWKVLVAVLGLLATAWFFLNRRRRSRQKKTQTDEPELPTASALE